MLSSHNEGTPQEREKRGKNAVQDLRTKGSYTDQTQAGKKNSKD